MPDQHDQAIEALFDEHRSFAPSAAFAAQANVSDLDIYTRAAADFEKFWEGEAERLEWFERWRKVLHWDDTTKVARWFDGGKLNVSHNCLDRHVAAGHGEQVAYHWEGEPGDARTISYEELLRETCRLANALRELGVRRGDRVAIYMGMVPRVAGGAASLLAHRRYPLGGLRRIFGRELARSYDRRGMQVARSPKTRDGAAVARSLLKNIADEALKGADCVEKVIVLRRVGDPCEMVPGRDVWYHDVVDRQLDVCAPERMDAEDVLYILYSSGTTAKPKGIVHTTGGYLTGHHLDPPHHLRSEARHGRLLVHGRHRLGDRALVHRLRRRSPTARRASSTKARLIFPTRTASGRSSRNTRSPSVTRHRRRSAPS